MSAGRKFTVDFHEDGDEYCSTVSAAMLFFCFLDAKFPA